MKIVTAGQRGIVATEDEIRDVRDNKRRIFSYSLILLFSICALGAANGAKLCRKDPVAGRDSVARNASDFSWFVGIGCCPNGANNPSVSCATTGTYSGTGAPTNSPCRTTLMAGKWTTNDNSSWGWVWNYEWKPTPIPENVSGKQFYYCKVGYPFVSQWINNGSEHMCDHYMANYSLRYIAMETAAK